MKTEVYILTVCAVLVSCTSSNHIETIHIKDASKDFRKEISFELKEGTYVDKLKITVQGNLNDTALFQSRRYLLPSNKVDTVFRGDYYAPGYVLDYKSLNVTEGELTFTLEFVVF
jgi:hypothetical protein